MAQQVNLKLEESTPWPNSLNDLAMYAKVRAVANIVFGCVQPRAIAAPQGLRWLEDSRWVEGALNPFYGQTKEGIFLELHYGYPARIWSRWGRWTIASDGGGFWGDALDVLLSSFGAEEYKPVEVTSCGEFGPVYALHKLKTKALPAPQVLSEHEYVSYEYAYGAWEAVGGRYKLHRRKEVILL